MNLGRCGAAAGLLMILVAVAAPSRAVGADPGLDAGERIYRSGQLASGAPLEGERGGVAIRGAQAACVNCHQRSGLGSSEGDIRIPPITGDYLFHSREHTAHEAELPYVESMHGNRDPYTDATLAHAIRDGVDSQGRPLSVLMPRFSLTDSDMSALIDYLRNLTVHRVAGVTETVLHFATVITPDADPARRSGVLDVLQHYFDEKNSFPLGPSPRMWTSGKTEYSKSMYMANRRWQLHVWELNGSPSDWEAQLDRHLAEEPVFAVLSGVGGSNWQPVHRFCERNAVPCLFPNVEVPDATDDDFYTLYFSQGVLLEANLIAKNIVDGARQSSPQVVQQFYRAGDSGEPGSKALANALRENGVTVRSHVITGADRGHVLRDALHNVGRGDVLVLWLRPADIAALGELPPPATDIYMSGLMGGLEDTPLPAGWRGRTRLAFPLDLPQRRGVRLDYPLGWFAFRHIPVVAEPAQVDTYLACSLLADVLHHDMADNISRPYLVEQMQRMLEHRLVTGYYPHLSLAAHQRFASKGGYLVHFSDPTGQRVDPDTEWTVP